MTTRSFEKLAAETCDPARTGLSVDAVGVAVMTSELRAFCESTALPCTLLNREFGNVVALSQPDLLPYVPVQLSQRLAHIATVEVDRVSEELTYFVAPLPQNDEFLVAGYVVSTRGVIPPELVLAGLEANWSEAQVDQWLKSVPVCDARLLRRLLEAAQVEASRLRRDSELQAEFDALSQQIDYNFEEISLLQRLTQHLQLSRAPAELADLCVRGIQTLIECSGVAICLENAEQSRQFFAQGRLPFDQSGFSRLLARFDQHNWSKPLVKNKLQHTLLGEDFPGLKNIVIVPIGDPQFRRGWIIGTNLRGGRDFGTVEANLICSIATILGTHIRNIELFAERDELLLGFVRSLVSTLDAKDPYTRGHSERVAMLARRLGETIGLERSDLEDIYLSGLLHDIGKIGVDDRILAKTGQLTEDEFHQIQRHPMIGYRILKQLRNLSRILPGVRNHHEAFNGRGYPDNLKGEGIPLMARIIAVADSYDAMVSDRPYRKGMPIGRLEEIFRRGSGEQWDPRVIDAYFECRDDIERLCSSYDSAEVNVLLESSTGGSSILTGRT